MVETSSAQGLSCLHRTADVVEEPSKELRVIVPADAEEDIKENIDVIVAAHKNGFRQQAVGIVIRPACASF